MYHRIDRPKPKSKVAGHYVSPDLFDRQMTTLAKLGYSSVSVSRIFDGPDSLPRKPIGITFDDGYENFQTHALPSLTRVGFSATVFLVTELMGLHNEWDTDAGDVEERLLSTEQVRSCHSSGTEFGSHTLTHLDLTTCPGNEAWRQISESKAAVEAVTGEPATAFCYPYGRHSAETREMVEKAGYRTACSTLKGLNSQDTDPFALKRINVRRDTSVFILLVKLLRGAWFDR